MELFEISKEIQVCADSLGEIVTTADGSLTIRHPVHQQTYHSSAGAETEARELYINSSGILERFSLGLPTSVLDVGLGLSYNAMATIDAWLAADQPGDLTMTSLEHIRDLVEVLIGGAAPWTRSWSSCRNKIMSAIKALDSGNYFVDFLHPGGKAMCRWSILIGDANRTVGSVDHQYHFIWQDPFSPDKNPGLWNSSWFSSVRSRCCNDAVLMSYSVARSVRDALSESGWSVERFKTPVREKRHWLRSYNRPPIQ